jgi:hypothetical protein
MADPDKTNTDPDDDIADQPDPDELRRVLSLAASAPAAAADAGTGLDAHLSKAVERQRRVARGLQSGGPALPPTLDAAIDALYEGRGRQRRIRSVPTSKLRIGSALAAAAAAAAVVVVVFAAGGSRQLSASSVADVWKLPATGGTATPNPKNPAVLDVSFHGSAFPNYHDSEGWRPGGTRPGRVDGRPEFTVFYVVGDRRAAYTVVATSGVSTPANAHRFVSHGVHLTEFRDRDRWVIVFPDRGNTCVLTAAAPREKQWLVKLAVWDSTRSVSA